MKKWLGLFVLLFLITGLTACGGEADEGTNQENGETDDKGKVSEISGPLTVNPDIPDMEVLDIGPNGEEAGSIKDLELSEEELKEIKDGNYTAAIVMHYSGTDYMKAAVNAMETTFEQMGIEVIAVTDANFSAETQVNNIESVLAKDPDIMVSVPVDAEATASAYRRAVDQGVKLVFMDGAANGLEAGKDYISIVTGDNYGNGVVAAELMAEQIGEEGKIGMLYHDVNFFVTRNRAEAFEETILEKYPNIEIVAKEGFTDENTGEAVGSAILTRDGDIDGIFAPWDVPAEGVMSAVRTAGKADQVVITTVDLGTNAAISIAADGPIKGLGAQLPYDQGVAQSMLGGYAVLDKEAPPYLVSPAIKVTKENVLESWELIYGEEAPQTVQDAMAQ
ncbi:substrate-binding domain-containing protein [Gracilibacillus alcaliphilus]|uniref:substrate-binding domain-containing protein n=1 Tax=Gracilibacillus alcaliphilus TaxID=1401441 RepID=UPI0019561DF6|nr:substrate-binding domain-containing protein [Gracilibacillus alcaliphilus]MBM7677600.1 ribose transport system substrate-binding protein [Gracilibacillus alcaliphilus]